MGSYDEKYHAARLEGAARSAAVVVPLLLELFPWVTSVVDAGCSAGAWLHEFQLHGISRVLGLEAQTFLLEYCKSMFPNSCNSTYVNHYHRWAASTS